MEDRARRYARIKYKLALADIAYTLFLLIVLQASGFAFWLKAASAAFSPNPFLLTALYSLSLFIIYTFLTFPLDFYRSFIVEHDFNLSNQKFFLWVLDYLKGNILGLLIFLILMEGFFFFNTDVPIVVVVAKRHLLDIFKCCHCKDISGFNNPAVFQI